MPKSKVPKPAESPDVQDQEDALDEALDESFPASDPVAISGERRPKPDPADSAASAASADTHNKHGKHRK
jgi:hypothetical protein